MFDFVGTAQLIPARILANDLRRLLRSATHSIKRHFPDRESEDGSAFGRVEPARYEEGLDYFTHVSVSRHDVPWADEIICGEEAKDWADVEITVEFEDASEEWLGVVQVG